MKNGQSIGPAGDSYERLMEALIARISRTMHDNGMTQKMLAEKTGLSQPTISNLISGKRKRP